LALNNSQYQAIMRSYEQKQRINKDKLKRRYEEVEEKLPALPRLEESASILSVQYGKKLLNGDDTPLEAYKIELDFLLKQKAEYLVQGGFPADYLEPLYDCHDCLDTGYIGNQKCHCFKNAAIKLLYEQSNLKEILEHENFASFSYQYYPESFIDSKNGRNAKEVIQEAVAICKSFIDSFSTAFQNLYIYGNIGVGKTFLLNCIAKEIMDREHSVLYFSATELFDILVKGAFTKGDVDRLNLTELIYSCDLLLIDDLGTEFVNQATVTQLFTCLNERLLNKKSVIISSNLSPKDLANLYNERVLSRIANTYDILRIIGDDIRLQKKFNS